MGNVSGDSKYWDNFWSKENYSNLQKLSWPNVSKSYGHKRISDHFNGNIEGLKVLECGSGSAEVSKALVKQGAVCDLLDISEISLKKCSKEFKEMGYEVGIFYGDVTSISTLTNNKKYDLIYSGGLLHHLEDLVAVADSMKASLEEEGIIMADFIPDKFSLQTLADFQKTLIYFFRELFKGKFRGLLKSHSHIPDTFVSKRPPKAYLETFVSVGLNASLYTATIYPSFALPKFLEGLYSRFLLSKYSFWEKLYRKDSKLLNYLSISYTLYATKNIRQ